MGQGVSARDFAPSESMENAGILCVFPIFHTARLGQKIRRSPQLPLCGVALDLLGGIPSSLPDEISPSGSRSGNFTLAFLIGLCYSIEDIIPAGVLEW